MSDSSTTSTINSIIDLYELHLSPAPSENDYQIRELFLEPRGVLVQ